MKKHILLIPLAVALTIPAACSGPDSGTSNVGAGDLFVQYDLIKVDSIGIELGDSCYVFGTIIDATFLQDGRIALLDMQRRTVLVYSGTGEFLTQAGSGGSGPGEFLLPFSLAALSSGGFAVSDIHAGKLVFFDSSCTFSHELIGFYPMAPMSIDPGLDGAIIGKRMNYYFDEETEQVYSGSEYAAWSDSTEPDIIFLECYTVHGRDDRPSYICTSDPQGRFFCCLSSKDEYIITGFTAAGDTSFSTEIPYETMRLTQEELDVARPHLVVPGPGSESTTSELTADWTPDSTRNAGFPLGVDDRNRLWVRSGRGETASPVFDLFGADDGELQLSIESTLPSIARFWNLDVSEQGILGWDHNPSDYPRVYILELIEP